jgi:hypothetical protein
MGAEAERILQAYRRHAHELPSTELDRRILAMAAKAIPATRAQPLGWLRYAASIAVLVIGAGMTWRMIDEGPAPGTAIDRARVNESAQSTAVTAPTVDSAAIPRGAAGSASADRLEEQITSATAREANVQQRSAAPSVDAMTAPPAASASAKPQAALASSEPESASPKRAPIPSASPLASAPTPVSTTQGLATVQAEPANSAANAGADSSAKRARISPLDPVVWLDNVRSLRDSGHIDEARVSLREWRLRYPRAELPADLHDLLDAAISPMQPIPDPPR